MNTIYGILLTILLLTTRVGNSQSFAVNISAPTCSTCCDGSMTITTVGCTGGVGFYIWPSLMPTSSIVGMRWVFDFVCCGQYSLSAGGGQDNCSPWWYKNFEVPCHPTSIIQQHIYQTPELVFPNPSTGNCFIKTDGLKTIEISDFAGNIVRCITSDAKEVDISDLRAGIYIISIYLNNGILISRQKLIRT